VRHIWVKIYERVMGLSTHPKASRYLALLSFVDASVFPISPLFMLLPMSFSKPERAFFLAGITTISSILGGVLGYWLGFATFKSLVQPFLEWMGYMAGYQVALQWFDQWGYWAIVLGSLSPFIPYKIFTIGAGVMQLNLGWFLLASTFARGLRFFLIAGLIYWGGPKVEPVLRRALARLG
jgi:membrane protein YqaA with SNARE-associated domain